MSAQVKFRQVVAEGKALKWILAFVLGLAVLLLVVLGVYKGTSVIGPAAEQSVTISSDLLAANPELMVARRYTAPETVGTESASLAENPELMVARRYIAVPANKDESGSPAANPEIIRYRGYRPDRRR